MDFKINYSIILIKAQMFPWPVEASFETSLVVFDRFLASWYKTFRVENPGCSQPLQHNHSFPLPSQQNGNNTTTQEIIAENNVKIIL